MVVTRRNEGEGFVGASFFRAAELLESLQVLPQACQCPRSLGVGERRVRRALSGCQMSVVHLRLHGLELRWMRADLKTTGECRRTSCRRRSRTTSASDVEEEEVDAPLLTSNHAANLRPPGWRQPQKLQVTCRDARLRTEPPSSRRPRRISPSHPLRLPDFLSLSESSAILCRTPILLGAQDCCDEDSGEFTGEVSPKHLAELGVALVEIGLAERRALCGETDDWIARKACAAVRNGLTPVACIGEKHEGSAAIAVVEIRPQILSVLNAIPSTADIIFAYEPVWAIGQESPASAAHVVAVSKALRTIAEEGGKSGKVTILNGGSVGRARSRSWKREWMGYSWAGSVTT